MKLLNDVIENIQILETHGNLDVSISSLVINSNKIKDNSLFIAIVGNNTDGHLYINECIKKGVKVIVYQNNLDNYIQGVTYLKVIDTKEALGIMASNFYDHPSRKLKLIGVTGTNGKTTIATLLYQLFRNLGYKVGMMGTVVNKINDKLFDTERTTPDSITLNRLLDMMVEEGCKYCFMEVSSHAVGEKRIKGLIFSGGVFTNLTLDHLDYHKTFDNYRDIKKSFFDFLPETSFALSNKNDPNGEYILKNTKAKKYFYLLKGDADFSGYLETKLIGEFNAYNALAIYGTAIALGEDEARVKEEMKKLEPVVGRFQYIKSPSNVTGIVDYAHTPDALENVLRTIGDMKGNNKVISVFGCGGDRDKTKRPIMTRIGYDMSDVVILTSDNPRTEDSATILNDMQKGIESLTQDKVLNILDRREAIAKACTIAKSGDYILLAGKGHEKYQEINGLKSYFDDMEELKKFLK